MILSCSWISLPCLSNSVIIRVFPRLCVLLTFFKLLDTSIVSRISSKLCFRISSFAFFYGLTYLHIFYVVSGGLVLYHFSTLLHQNSCRRCYFRGFRFIGLFCYDQMHFVGSFQSCSYLDCKCRHVLLML